LKLSLLALTITEEILITPLFAFKKEYELVYDGKEREEDIIAETMSVPLQPVKTFGKNGENGWTNKLIFIWMMN